MAPFEREGKLHMANIYIREAHPSDGWESSGNKDGETLASTTGRRKKICYLQTKRLADRLAVARDFQAAFEGSSAGRVPLLVDDPATNALDIAYEAPPERLVLVRDGRVLFCSGQGPFQYSIEKLRAFLSSAMPEES